MYEEPAWRDSTSVPWKINPSVNKWCMFWFVRRTCYMPKRSVILGLGPQGPNGASYADGVCVTSDRKTQGGKYFSECVSDKDRDRGVCLLDILQTQ